MTFPDSIPCKVRGCNFAITGQLLFCLLTAPLLVWGQSTPVISDSLRAEQFLSHALKLRNNGEFTKSNNFLNKSASIFEQSRYPTRAAHCYNHISSNLRLAGKPDSAEVFAHTALNMVPEFLLEDPTESIRAYTNLGLIEADRARYDNSLDFLQKAYRLTDNPVVDIYLKTTVLGSLGYLYDDLGAYDKALLYYEESLDILTNMDDPPKGRMAKLYNNIGYTYKNQGLYDQALESYKKELELNLQAKPETHPDIAIAHINLGSSHYRRGDYGQALLHFQKSLETALAAYGEEHKIAYISYENTALCHIEMGEYDKAIVTLHRAADIKEKTLGSGHPDLASTFKSIGLAYSKQGKVDRALNYSKRALNTQLKSLGNQHPKLIDTYIMTGTYFAKKGQPDSSFHYLAKAEALTQAVLSPHHVVLAKTYAAMAKTYESIFQYKKADAFYEQALGILANDTKLPITPQNITNGVFQYPVYTTDILFDKARMLDMAYHNNGDITHLEAALSTFKILSRLLDNIQVGYANKLSKLVIGRKSHTIYEHAIQTAYMLYQKKKNSAYLEQIFFFAEKSKARILLESAIQNRSQQYAGIPDSVITYERSLKGHINAMWAEMDFLVANASGQGDRLSSLRDSLISLNRQLLRFRNFLNQNYPHYHTLKFGNRVSSVAEIQKQLAEKKLSAVEYFLGEHSLFAIVITGNSLTVKKLSPDSDLTNTIHTFTQAVTQRNDSSYLMLGTSLYNTLIKPIESFIASSSQLLIIPDGVMALLPFEALLAGNVSPEDSNYRNLPYLLWDYNIAYAPSLTLSTALQEQKDQSYQTNLLAFAPGFEDSIPDWEHQAGSGVHSKWNALPFSKMEVKGIASLFKKQMEFWELLFNPKQVSLFLDESASESHLKNATDLNARYIHMATHAFVSDDQSQLAGILLYPDRSQGEDGILFAYEIYGLSLNADLVTLSACDTGSGSVIKGEGIMSLSRAFQFAGAKNLLVSTWKVADRSSAKLMLEFYRRLIRGKNKISALQEAKRGLVRNTMFAHPYYWAPFILIGS